MSFWKRISPTRAAKDFAHEFGRPNPYRWRLMAASAAATFAIFSVMWQEGGRAPPIPPEVTYITSWRADRTDEEIIASNIANQKRKDRLQAEQAARNEQVKEIYRSLGEVSGMDVEKIEQEAESERSAEERELAERREEMWGAGIGTEDR